MTDDDILKMDRRDPKVIRSPSFRHLWKSPVTLEGPQLSTPALN